MQDEEVSGNYNVVSNELSHWKVPEGLLPSIADKKDTMVYNNDAFFSADYIAIITTMNDTGFFTQIER